MVIIVPCFNEAARLDGDALLGLLEHPGVSVLLVDDGSTDNTETLLRDIAARAPERIDVLVLPRNVGKAEAVRAGLVHAVAGGADAVGYIDADLATPVSEVLRMVGVMDETGAEVVIGARVALLGTEIKRSPSRHYLGRIFATAASLALGERIYDTQCGAKLFRTTPGLRTAIDSPFRSRWAFDVELLGRLIRSRASIVEVPLRQWADVPGSKMKLASMARAGVDLVSIAADLRRKRRGY